jgi:hypothetical protein
MTCSRGFTVLDTSPHIAHGGSTENEAHYAEYGVRFSQIDSAYHSRGMKAFTTVYLTFSSPPLAKLVDCPILQRRRFEDTSGLAIKRP